KELPEIEAKISSGTLSLTTLGMAKALFKKEGYSRDQKLTFLQSLENTPTREAAKIIAAKSPEALVLDRVRPISEEKLEFKFSASRSLHEKLERLKGKWAHTHP